MYPLSSAVLCFSCTTEEPGEAQPEAQELVTVGFNMKGELSVSQVPLKSSEKNQDHPDLFGIQIYQANGFPYAYVVGDDLSKISVDLPKNEVFTVKATYVKDGKEKIVYRPRMEEWGSPLSYPE